MKEYPRSRRVGDQVQRELAVLIRDEMNDPRASMVTVTEVRVSRDLSHARVFVSTLDRDRDPAELEKVLNGAAGFLRSALGARMQTRTVPELKFCYDHVLDEGARMQSLIDGTVRSDRARGGDGG